MHDVVWAKKWRWLQRASKCFYGALSLLVLSWVQWNICEQMHSNKRSHLTTKGKCTNGSTSLIGNKS